MLIQHEQQPSQLKVAGAVCFYIVAALVMLVVNKAVLNKAPDLPFTFLFIQLVIAVLLLRVLAFLSRTSIQRLLPTTFELPQLDHSIARKLFPYLSVGFLGLVFNTLCLRNGDASFFLIARGLLLPFTILVSSLFTRAVPKTNVLLATAVVTFGFFIGVVPSFDPRSNTIVANEPIKALVYGFFSSMVLSIHTVLSKVLTAHKTHSVVALSYWGNLLMSLMIVPCILVNGEVYKLQRRLSSPDQDWGTFVAGSVVTGIFGFLLGIANVLSIKVTSPVTHMFSSAAKSVLQTLLGVLIFGDIITVYRLGGITLITVGTIFYTWTQSMKKPSIAGPIPDVEKQDFGGEQVELQEREAKLEPEKREVEEKEDEEKAEEDALLPHKLRK
ncbi:hypothetical protein B0H11DRAFT_1867872 [Mycena galericulata]|nr:hypothetical protein B0H11DRAFT_1867872 [Mycena galericulata]